MEFLYEYSVSSRIVYAVICGAVGFWMATRANLQGSAGAIMGAMFSLSISLGVGQTVTRSGLLPALILILLTFVTFSVLLGPQASRTAIKVAALTLILSVAVHYMAITKGRIIPRSLGNPTQQTIAADSSESSSVTPSMGP